MSVLTMLLVACARDPIDPRFEEILAPPVEAVTARRGALPLVERLSGTVYAENQLVLYPEISGRIVAVHVENGATVTRGQPLVELTGQQYREQLRQAEAGYRINQARVRQAEAQLAELQAQERRIRSLGDRELVTELELETLAAQLESARADVALAQAQLEEAAATLAEQEELLTKTIVRAPVDGVVGERNAEIGMHATPSTQLFTIGNLDRVRVSVNVSDKMLPYIQAGQPVQITTRDAGNDRIFRGRLTRISPFLNEVTRSAVAEIEIENPEHWLRPGMFVPVDVLYGESREATLVPTSALFTDPNTGTEGVYVVAAPEGEAVGSFGSDGGRQPAPLSEPRPVQFRAVDVIARGEMEVAVGSLEPGDWVVTIGQDLLSTGRSEARVRPVTWEHVMALQGMKREDLLQEVLRGTVEAMPTSSSQS